MEKENKKARDDARREYNDTVRVRRSHVPCRYLSCNPQALAMFVRKRDPRYKSHLATQAAMAAAKASGQGGSPRTPQKSGTSTPVPSGSCAFVEQSWQKAAFSREHADLEWAAAENGEDSEEWECVACSKTFRSEAAWDSHERSKKHLQAVERLKREMAEENELLGLEAEGDDIGKDGLADQPQMPTNPSLDETKSREGDDEGGQVKDEPSPTIQDGSQPKKPARAKKKERAPSPEVVPRTEREAKTRPADTLHDSIAEKMPSLDLSDDYLKSSADGQQDIPTQPEMSKRDKRRAREAAKKAREAETGVKQVIYTSLV